MADTTTHSIFSIEIIENLSKSDVLKKHLDIYKLASQGPDPFFYLPSSYEHSGIGGKMHEENTGLFFVNLIAYLKKNYSDELLTYVTGFINHFSLDSSIHPYVFYTTGVYDKTDKSTYKYRGQHLMLERTIDNILIKRKLKKNYRFFNVCRFNFSLDDKVVEIERALNHVLKQTYGIEQYGTYYFEAFKRMKKVFKNISVDRTGLKRLALKLYDKTLNKVNSVMYQHLSYNLKIRRDLDYLNEQHASWYHPSTNEASNKSFLDLYEEGKLRAKALNTVLTKYLNDQIDEVALRENFKDISYSSGLVGAKEDSFKHFGSIPKK